MIPLKTGGIPGRAQIAIPILPKLIIRRNSQEDLKPAILY